MREDVHPWWRYGHVWLVLGLLTFAICASLGLVYAAVKIMKTDSVYSDPLHPQDGSPPRVTQANMLPAEEGRNFAATGGVGAPDLKASVPAPAANRGEGSPYAPADDGGD
ncbi:MAG: hypothetical protein LBU72_00375 [Burkholderiaceae bacterium]|jgi:hypothetical protein|nr:hypothetical protein [Burkholderiaceae bacterium]